MTIEPVLSGSAMEPGGGRQLELAKFEQIVNIGLSVKNPPRYAFPTPRDSSLIRNRFRDIYFPLNFYSIYTLPLDHDVDTLFGQ